jgi:hypothetical protein
MGRLLGLAFMLALFSGLFLGWGFPIRAMDVGGWLLPRLYPVRCALTSAGEACPRANHKLEGMLPRFGCPPTEPIMPQRAHARKPLAYHQY